MKYLILDNDNIEVAVLFDELLQHKQIAGGHKVVAAGFCLVRQIDDPGADLSDPLPVVEVWGKSVGLGIGTRPNDPEVILESLNRRVLA